MNKISKILSHIFWLVVRFNKAKSESIKDYYNVGLFLAKFMSASIYKFEFQNYSSNSFCYNFQEVQKNCAMERVSLDK